MDPSQKPVNALILDAGPIIRNTPSISSLLAKSTTLYATRSIISEIRDEVARARIETTYMPFLTLREPNPRSVKIVTDFARKTGDVAVLSRQDVEVMALAYELECELNGGDWRLRSTPGQKRMNGAPPKKEGEKEAGSSADKPDGHDDKQSEEQPKVEEEEAIEQVQQTEETRPDDADVSGEASLSPSTGENEASQEENTVSDLSIQVDDTHLEESLQEQVLPPATIPADTPAETSSADSNSEGSDSEGWITPSNLRKKQAKDEYSTSTSANETPSVMQVATLTTDFAMQNVLLQMNLNLLSPALQRVKHIKTYIKRCHACFYTTKDTSKDFCPRCGGATLTRVACSTNANGEFKMHLKKNMQWNHRGDRFSIPKPVPGSASGRVGQGKGGGKGGWGQELILAEDQKEYVRAVGGQGRKKERDLMDQDYLPGILTGERRSNGGKPKVGAGRNVNSRKR